MMFDTNVYFEYLAGKDSTTTVFGHDYLNVHRKRYEHTVRMLAPLRGTAALEIGATDFFQLFLGNTLGFSDVWGTIFANSFEKKLTKQTFTAAGYSVESTVVDLQLENELFPIFEPRFDLVLLCEVIEHMDVDPMFCLIELNRIIKPGGKLLITTPNICSARNVYKICHGWRPHFYMQYHRDRSPYRHNFEHDVHSLIALVEAAGFSVVSLDTADVFEETDERGLQLLKKNKLPLEHRGDDIFMLVEKTGQPTERWPAGVYV